MSGIEPLEALPVFGCWTSLGLSPCLVPACRPLCGVHRTAGSGRLSVHHPGPPGAWKISGTWLWISTEQAREGQEAETCVVEGQGLQKPRAVHGLNDRLRLAKDLQELLEDLDLKDVILAGHSMGCSVQVRQSFVLKFEL